MERQSDIIDQYQHSDFNARLNMYLSHPELRNEFIKIDSKHPDMRLHGHLEIPISERFSQLLCRLRACVL
ncbi:MAG: hypothetical protein MI892_14660 [Desulfobacterales bacterium]|nr:hypothetical protein [Desulfobacterales bacterium]